MKKFCIKRYIISIKKIYFALPVLAISVFFTISCEEDIANQYYGNELSFSQDSLFLDTLFTRNNSITKILKIYNKSSKTLQINKINLFKGANSPFLININGVDSYELQNVHLQSKDSLYLFIAQKPIYQNLNSILAFSDSINITLYDKFHTIPIFGWTEDAHQFNQDLIISNNTTFYADKPYLFNGNVIVNSQVKLTINEGARIFFASQKGLYVKGELNVNGKTNNQVKFKSSRRESGYNTLPGGWYGIVGNKYSSGTLENAIIENGTVGLQLGFPYEAGSGLTEWTLKNVQIKNMLNNGILAVNSKASIDNSIISASGDYTVSLNGGEYSFVHSSIDNHWKWESQSPRKGKTLLLSNTFISGNASNNNNLNAKFYNTIISGNQTSEIEWKKKSGYSIIDIFDHCLLNLSDETTSDQNRYISVLKTKPTDNIFLNPQNGDLQLINNSLAIDFGALIYANNYPNDINGKYRLSDNKPDVGAFEF